MVVRSSEFIENSQSWWSGRAAASWPLRAPKKHGKSRKKRPQTRKFAKISGNLSISDQFLGKKCGTAEDRDQETEDTIKNKAKSTRLVIPVETGIQNSWAPGFRIRCGMTAARAVPEKTNPICDGRRQETENRSQNEITNPISRKMSISDCQKETYDDLFGRTRREDSPKRAVFVPLALCSCVPMSQFEKTKPIWQKMKSV